MKKHIPIARPLTTNEELKAIEEVLKSGMLAQGRAVGDFENAFCDYLDFVTLPGKSLSEGHIDFSFAEMSVSISVATNHCLI
ncbi:MAG: DegT/DnrJ/EryC1/StrS family aminotransferase [Euryarchaeota archaeon]|nr:DegT/DnrJ/EryC1/StrS family aminotransferase [Euryarchaeota archaeon]